MFYLVIAFVFIFLLIMASLLIPVLSTPPDDKPTLYVERSCLGGEWVDNFPNATKDHIRQFLNVLIESMDFDKSILLKFSPTDKVIDIYHSIYDGKAPLHDYLECESFYLFISQEFNIPDDKLSSIWNNGEVTLGEIFFLTMNGQYESQHT